MKWRTGGKFSNISWPYALEVLADDGTTVLGLAIYQDRTPTQIRYKFGEKQLTLNHLIVRKSTKF